MLEHLSFCLRRFVFSGKCTKIKFDSTWLKVHSSCIYLYRTKSSPNYFLKPVMALTSVLIVCFVVGQVLAQDSRRPVPQEPETLRPVPAPAPSGGCRGGFTVRKAVTRGLGPDQKVRFQDVLTNTGGWSQSSSSYRAPCNGVYYFSFHALSAENSDFQLGLMKDGDYQVTAYGSKGDFQHGSNSALLELRRGDTVYIVLQEGKIYEHPRDEAYTSFTGFLVARD